MHFSMNDENSFVFRNRCEREKMKFMHERYYICTRNSFHLSFKSIWMFSLSPKKSNRKKTQLREEIKCRKTKKQSCSHLVQWNWMRRRRKKCTTLVTNTKFSRAHSLRILMTNRNASPDDDGRAHTQSEPDRPYRLPQSYFYWCKTSNDRITIDTTQKCKKRERRKDKS